MKKALRFGVPALVLSGLVAAAFTFSAREPRVTAASGNACVASTPTTVTNVCYPPDPACIKAGYCMWICP